MHHSVFFYDKWELFSKPYQTVKLELVFEDENSRQFNSLKDWESGVYVPLSLRLSGIIIWLEFKTEDPLLESGMFHWLRVEARDQEIRVRFPVPAVISNLVTRAIHPSQFFVERDQKYHRSTVRLHTPHAV